MKEDNPTEWLRIWIDTYVTKEDAGVQLQQSGIQPEEMNGVGNEAATQSSWTAYLFQV